MTTMTRTDERSLSRLAKDLQREADRARLAGLDERADTLEAEAATATERLQEARTARRERDRKMRARKQEAEERHAAAMKAREREAERREAARTWIESAIARFGSQPQPAESLLTMAESAGHRPDDVEAVAVRVRRRGRHTDGTEYLALPGTFLRRSWLEVEAA